MCRIIWRCYDWEACLVGICCGYQLAIVRTASRCMFLYCWNINILSNSGLFQKQMENVRSCYLLDCVDPANILISCVIICPHCIFTRVNCGSATSASPNTTNDTRRELGNSLPVIEMVGAAYPSP